MKLNNLLFITGTFQLLLLNTIICHKKSHNHEEIDHEKAKFLTTDFRSIFDAYGESLTSMNVTQLNNFIDTFQTLIGGNNTETGRCLTSRFTSFNGLVSKWGNETIIDRNTFAKISSYLISYVSKCFKNPNEIENYAIDKEGSKLTGWQKFVRNVPLISKEKWIYTLLSVVIISIVGLLCVVFIPILNACCFDYLFQFLVALALGTLAGDSFLHLIPHAFMPAHSHSLEFLDDFDSENPAESHQSGVYKGLGCLVGMYVFFLIEKVVQAKQVDKEAKPTGEIAELNELMKHGYSGEVISKKKAHSHGHSHGNKGEMLKSNAWMVILGDALHNFSDGLAIGASFAVSLTAGFGTVIAVFFHELPHEIGDFAVLRRAGVSMKMAVIFNILSSAFCFIGAVIGILIGGIQALNNWSFLFIAGTFIYISLVDIIPELNENGTANDTKMLNFFIQNCGIIMGVVIMFLIAIYEDSIQTLFG